MRHRTDQLRPQDLLKLGKPAAVSDRFIVVARVQTFQPPREVHKVQAGHLVAYQTTGRALYSPLGRIRPLPFNASPRTIEYQAKLWIHHLAADHAEAAA